MATPRIAAFTLATLFTAPAVSAEPPSNLSIHKVAEYSAAEAHQAVAVDKTSFFAITSRAIGRYDKRTGERKAKWSAPEGSPVIHLNSGIVIDGKLYCANSNWPKSPLRNTVEVFEATTLAHLDRIEFSETAGAINWIDRRDGSWWVVFAYYATQVEKTRLVRYSEKWDATGNWTFPATVLKRFSPNSNSGGAFTPDGRLFATGHDHAEMYVLELPVKPGVMKHIATVAAPIAGQGIAWDVDQPNRLFGIVRKKRTVVSMRLDDNQKRRQGTPAN